MLEMMEKTRVCEKKGCAPCLIHREHPRSGSLQFAVLCVRGRSDGLTTNGCPCCTAWFETEREAVGSWNTRAGVQP